MGGGAISPLAPPDYAFVGMDIFRQHLKSFDFLRGQRNNYRLYI